MEDIMHQYVLELLLSRSVEGLASWLLPSKYSLRIHCIFIAYSLRIHCVSIAYSLRIHCVSIAYPLRIHCVSAFRHPHVLHHSRLKNRGIDHLPRASFLVWHIVPQNTFSADYYLSLLPWMLCVFPRSSHFMWRGRAIQKRWLKRLLIISTRKTHTYDKKEISSFSYTYTTIWGPGQLISV